MKKSTHRLTNNLPSTTMTVTSDRIRALAALFLLSVWAGPAAADDSGFYVGAAAGQSKIESDTQGVSGHAGVTQQASRRWLDDTSSSWSVLVGYRLNSYFGFEGSYWDFGEVSYDDVTITRQVLGPVTITDRLLADASIRGPALGLFGSFPLGNWEVRARASVLFAQVTTSGTLYSLRVTTLPPASTFSTTSVDESTDSENFFYGASVNYGWANHYRIGIEWSAASALGGDDQAFDGLDVDTLALRFQY